jgi:hypothetical protein
MIAGISNASSTVEVLDGAAPVLSMARSSVASDPSGGSTSPVAASVSTSRGMSNEECVAAARMTMWRLGGHSR